MRSPGVSVGLVVAGAGLGTLLATLAYWWTRPSPPPQDWHVGPPGTSPGVSTYHIPEAVR